MSKNIQDKFMFADMYFTEGKKGAELNAKACATIAQLYAQQESIAFAEWAFKNGYYYNGTHWKKIEEAYYLSTTEQLYNLFKQQP